ncbi:hypothetical protein DRE_00234 [Drechslerella stenobrocha 248]|uniref:Uncharacterized protein n=1 Tax=Drechslerella stenobrocha 248 TaxID=1043628 RepID=W7HZI8_9PEZI|nr:hypothetical protein DRE_00234 [Drechslerella stenobrocha 248]
MDHEVGAINPVPHQSTTTAGQDAEKSQTVYRQEPLRTSVSKIEPTEEVAASSDGASIPSGRSVQTGWTPLILRPWSLLIFLVLYVGIFFTLIGLYVRSKRNQGLSSEKESRHYLWTYGPTAVFILLAAFWRHLDYHAKLLMPWIELASGPKHAKLTVLLDYISPFQPVAFWDACKNRHWLIVLTGLAFATLKIATVFATGLFVLQGVSMEVTREGFLQYTDQFSAAGFDSARLDSRPSFTVYGIFAQNLTYPAGTNRRYAFQSFASAGDQSLEDITSISVPADVFSAKLDCQPARLNWTDDRDRGENAPLSQFYNATAFSPGCTLKLIRLDAPNWMGDTPQQGYYARIQNSTCDEIQDPVAGHRLFVAMTYSTREDFVNTLRNYTAFVCEPSYSIRRSQVTVPSNRLNDESQVVSVEPLADAVALPGLSVKGLTEGIVTTLRVGSQLAINEWDRSLDTFFQLMTLARPDLDYAAFMEPDVLKAAASDMYTTIAAQVAGSVLRQPMGADSRPIDAVVTELQQRLILRPVSVIVMEVIVGILIAITIGLLIMMPRHGVAPRDPSSLGALATILSRSREFERSLSGTSNLSESDLGARLQKYRFYSRVETSSEGRTFKLELEDCSPAPDGDGQHPEDVEKTSVGEGRNHWWKPLGLKWWVVLPLVALPIAIIIVLEVLYRQSQRNRGLAYIPIGGYLHYTWVYIPAMTMVLLVTLFGMLDYATRCIAPYQAMRADSTSASRGILYNPSGKLTLPALWHAIKEKHVTVIATTFAVLIAPVLTIAVSGLFSAVLSTTDARFTVQQASWFNTSFPETSDSTTDNLITGLIVASNLSYPTWTYDNLALAQLTVPNDGAVSNEAADSVTLNAPAVRAVLNCTVIPPARYGNITVDLPEEDDEENVAPRGIDVDIKMPDGCGNSGFNDFNDELGTYLEAPETGYFGGVLSLNGGTCPDFAVFYGRTDNRTVANFSTIVCNGWVQAVDVKTNFLLPNFTISDVAPQPLEETARWFSNQTADIQFRFAAVTGNSSAVDTFDEFLSAVVYGKGGTPASELEDPAVLISAVKHIYGIAAAQTITQDTRIPNEGPASFITGTSRTKPRARLVQSETSTRLLQVLLGFIAVTTIVAHFGVKARELLPRESNSIATIGGYLAGSDVLRLVPHGAEWSGEQEAGSWFKGHMFGFGWWDDAEREGQRRYGVGIGRADGPG